MQLRTITLATATVAVFGALVVLFFQVRAPQEIEVPEDALSLARSRYELTRGAPAPAAFQADHGEAASRPSRRPGTREGLERPGAPAARPARSPAALGRPTNRGPTNLPADLPPDASPQLIRKREAVRETYDTGDFESALTHAEEFLRLQPTNNYVKRVAAVSACALGDEAVARRHYQKMEPGEQRLVAKRCKRFGMQF